MRTHSDAAGDRGGRAAPAADRSPARSTGPVAPAGTSVSAGPGAWAMTPVLSAAFVRRLGAVAGNRATARMVGDHRPGQRAVQRYLSGTDATAVAAQLQDAMAGLGTDEEAIYGALAGRRAEDIREIRRAYQAAYNKDLLADLRDELTDDEYERIRPSLEAPEEGAMTAGARQASTIDRSAAAVQQLHDAMEGLGTEEAQIFNVLTGRQPTEISEIVSQYAMRYGVPLEDDLRDELSGDDLARALSLIGRTDEGRVSTREREQLVEGIDATVVGDFSYRLSENLLDIAVPVHFVPAPGTTVQLEAWNAGIASTWNQFAFTSAGGRRVAVHMALRDDSGASRVVNVIQNAVPNTYASPDRANAATFYQTLPPDTVAHEFGHLIGLADEYQRTAADFEVVTGEAPAAGNANASGRTPEQIAADLHTALTTGAAAGRETAAEQVLVAAGMYAGQRPQQGDFAQQIRRAYDAAYGGTAGTDLISTLQGLRDNWWTTMVFSYASETVMGLQGKYGLGPHEHPVMPRHLRELRAIVQNRWPDQTWEMT